MPRSATLGKISARKVTWDGTTLTAEFDLSNAPTGAQTVTVVFPGPPGIPAVTFTLKNGYTVR